ncbi:MAG: chemotaxis protein CheD, partial [Deltaproteobacteria bacterium]|nr:chemotaxis protein CheD [Candidatus Anaeroferrophillacea bacterium]
MKPQVRIHIGEYYASDTPTVIHTVLGSCISVCLHDPARQIGGMNHILLPGRADLEHFDTAARYGINAVELLINRIMQVGGDRRRLVAKVFGGAGMLSAVGSQMGRKNSDFVFAMLQEERIRVVTHDVGGTDSRTIYFHTDTNEVFLKRLQPSASRRISTAEAQRQRQIRQEAEKPADIT